MIEGGTANGRGLFVSGVAARDASRFHMLRKCSLKSSTSSRTESKKFRLRAKRSASPFWTGRLVAACRLGARWHPPAHEADEPEHSVGGEARKASNSGKRESQADSKGAEAERRRNAGGPSRY